MIQQPTTSGQPEPAAASGSQAVNTVQSASVEAAGEIVADFSRLTLSEEDVALIAPAGEAPGHGPPPPYQEQPTAGQFHITINAQAGSSVTLHLGSRSATEGRQVRVVGGPIVMSTPGRRRVGVAPSLPANPLVTPARGLGLVNMPQVSAPQSPIRGAQGLMPTSPHLQSVPNSPALHAALVDALNPTADAYVRTGASAPVPVAPMPTIPMAPIPTPTPMPVPTADYDPDEDIYAPVPAYSGKWHAVIVRRRVGIYPGWLAMAPYVTNVSGNQHKLFQTRAEAAAYYYAKKAEGEVQVVAM